jgi:hypothetical protein
MRQLVQHGGRPAQAGALFGQRGIGGQRGHEVGAVALHLAGRGLVDQVAVFDAAHAGLHRAGDGPRRIGMGQCVEVGGLGLLHRGAQFVHRELRAVDRVAGARDTAAGHDLDLVGALAHLLAHGAAHLATPSATAPASPGRRSCRTSRRARHAAACRHGRRSA